MTVRHNRGPYSRQQTGVDRLVAGADQALRSIFSNPSAGRQNPAADRDDGPLRPEERRHAARLMRVNHAGEVSAQALYQGQALTARGGEVRDSMAASASEESDHLSWCNERLTELGGRRSLLNPVWYAGSFAIGALAGMAGDRWSLGFIAETERQVVRHLDDHMELLPEHDTRSRAILSQMREDEAEHGEKASRAGGRELPSAVQKIMGAVSRVMTRTAYWV